MRKVLLISLVACAGLRAQTVPLATDLPSHPFFIKTTWYIGGAGTWDYLTMDSRAGRLYIAHGTTVQVVDVETGALAGTLNGFYEARQVVLDDTGQLGYISDGGQGKVAVFDRQTLRKVAEIDTGANPRSMVYDALTKLLFVVRANPPEETPADVPVGQPNRRRPAEREGAPAEVHTQSKVTVIDTQNETAIGEISLPGLLGFAVGDENDDVFIAATDRNLVYRFDAQAVAALMRDATVHETPGHESEGHESPEHEPPAGESPAHEQAESAPPPEIAAATGAAAPAETEKASTPWVALDWTGGAHSESPDSGHVSVIRLSPDCADPASLAMDNAHMRLFAACSNRKLVVVNALDGNKLATLPIGPGADAVGYDRERGLIFTANGGAEGSMTIIRQDVTDTYAVIQTLPTRQRAGELAVDPGTGDVFAVTDYLGVALDRPGGIGTLVQTPVKGSFQVIEIAN
jgi:DNA-binding beta-propeller fold protein YncE